MNVVSFLLHTNLHGRKCLSSTNIIADAMSDSLDSPTCSHQSILKNYEALMSTLDTVQQGHDEYASKGKGLLMCMESFDLFFGLHLAYRVFCAAEQFSINLQAKDTYQRG